MFGPDSIYGLDIETDNSQGHGLNPHRSRITEISVAVGDGGEVFADENEGQLLIDTHRFLESLRPGLISTWNGSPFDLPFIDCRIRANGLFDLGPLLTLDPQVKPKYEPLEGYDGGYSAIWPIGPGRAAHQHLDVSFIYKKAAAELDVAWKLKPVATALGIEMIEEDRERLHLLTPEQRRAYCLSDSRGTRALALRALGYAA